MAIVLEPDAGSTLILGRGVNTITLEELNTGISTASAFAPNNHAGQTVVYEVRQIEEVEQLRETLNVSASAGFKSLSGGISAKASYFRSVAVSTFSLYIYIRVKVTNSATVLRTYELNDEAREVLLEEGAHAFFDKFGDEFVASVTTGGEYLAVLKIDNATKEEKEATKASLGIQYGGFTSKGDFEKSVEKLHQLSSSHLYVLRRGGSGKLPANAQEVKEFALGFPETVRDQDAVVLQVQTLPYSVVLDRPAGVAPIGLEQQRTRLEKLALAYDKLMKLRADFQYAAEFPYLFHALDSAAVQRALVECEQTAKLIELSVEQCKQSRGLTLTEPATDLPIVPLDWFLPLEPGLAVRVHAAGNGDMWGTADKYVGTKGESRQIEGISIAFNPPLPGLYVEYFVHGAGYGDTAWARDGIYVGTTGGGVRIEGFQVRLVGPLARFYDVLYSGHFQGLHDLHAQNDQYCGTRGESRRCEGIRVSVKRRL